MAFSDTVVQQREKQETLLKRFLIYSIAGSIALHGIALFLRVNRFGQPNDLASEEITIVATEPVLEDDREATVPVETGFADAPGGGGFSGSGGAPNAAPLIEAPAADVAPSAEKPQPESFSLAIAEENAVIEEGAETAETRDLSSLLENLRRIRQQSSQTPGEGRVSTVGNSSGEATAVGTGSSTGSGTGTGNGNGNGNGNGTGEGTGSGTGSGTGEGTGVGETSPGESRARQGSSSREITCRSCDFDYPDSADGAEGTAQVIVETDAQGRVVSVMLSRSSGNAALDRAALEQARRRVHLNNARAGENYPIDIDFVQPDSEAAQRVREQGDRRSITVSDPESEAADAPETAPETVPETKTPETANNRSPEPEPSATAEPSVHPEPEPSTSFEPEQHPSRTPASGQPDSTNVLEPSAEPTPSDTMSRPEPSNSPAPAPVPAATPAPAPSVP